MYIDQPLAFASAPSLSLSLILTAGFLSLLVLAAVICFGLLGQRMGSLDARVSSREKTVVSLAAEMEAQALLVRQMSIDLEELRKRVSEQSQPAPAPAPLWAADMPVNLNRRGQIIRLSRKGKSVPEIASDLQIAQGEVELLLKVHDLGQAKSGAGEPAQ